MTRVKETRHLLIIFLVITGPCQIPGLVDPVITKRMDIANPLDPAYTYNQLQNGAMFLKIGTLANGLTYGHLTTTIDLRKLYDQIDAYYQVIQNLEEYRKYTTDHLINRERPKRSPMVADHALMDQWARDHKGKTVLTFENDPSTTSPPEFEVEVFEPQHLIPEAKTSGPDKESLTEEEKKAIQHARAIESQIDSLIAWIQLQVQETKEVLDATTEAFTRAGSATGDFPDEHKMPITFHRVERGVGLAAAGGLLAGGFVVSLFSHFRADDWKNVVEKQGRVLATQIEENIAHFSGLEKDVKILNGSLASAFDQINQIIENDKGRDVQHVALYHAWGITENLRIVRKVAHAIIEAHRGHFSSDLVKPKNLQVSITQMRNLAIENGKEIGIRTLADVFSLPTSYLFDPEKELIHIIAHTPLSDIAQDLDLYEYVPAPLMWEQINDGDDSFVEIRAPQNYIGLSKDQTMYRTFTDSQLEDCLRIDQVHFCNDLATYKIERPSCLSGLIVNDMEMVRDHCEINARTEATRVVRLNSSTYAMISSTADTYNIQCSGVSRTIPYDRGTTMIHIEPGCTVNNREVKIERAKFEPPVQMEGLIVSDPIKLVDLAPQHSEDQLKELFRVRKELGQVGQPIPLTQLKNLHEFQEKFETVSKQNLMGYTIPTSTLVIAALIFGGILFCCLKRRTQLLDCINTHRSIRQCCTAHRAEDFVGIKPPHLHYCTDIDGRLNDINCGGSMEVNPPSDYSLDSSFTPPFNSTLMDRSIYHSTLGSETLRGQKRTLTARRMMDTTTSSAPPNSPNVAETDTTMYSLPSYQLSQARNATT